MTMQKLEPRTMDIKPIAIGRADRADKHYNIFARKCLITGCCITKYSNNISIFAGTHSYSSCSNQRGGKRNHICTILHNSMPTSTSKLLPYYAFLESFLLCYSKTTKQEHFLVAIQVANTVSFSNWY